MPYKIIQEITGEELQNKYMIQSTAPRVTGWVKDIILSTGNKGEDYTGRLQWNCDDGYTSFWDNKTPPEAHRPEFEYILDSLTGGEYY